MKTFLQYLELALTVVGVVVVLVVFALFRHIAPWKAAALCAVAVGVIHGIIFYSVRSAQRRARRQSVLSIRSTLDDLVRNKLQVVLYPAEPAGEDWRSAAQQAVREIQVRLNYIESESLKAKKLQ